MKKYCLFLLLLFASVAKAEYFVIRDFHADIVVQKDGSLLVTEKIKVEFSEPRHGIFRVIPYVYHAASQADQRALNRRGISSYFRIWLRKVDVPGDPYTIETDGSVMNIRIGAESVMVNGVKEYTITYKVINALNHFADHDEVYWNVTGNDWQTEMDTASATVHFPDGFLPTADAVRVFQGVMGSKAEGIYRISADQLDISSAGNLQAAEGLTFVVKMPPGLVDTTLPPFLRITRWFWWFLPVIVLLLVVICWLVYGRDKKFTRMVAFHPPAGLTPAEAGLLIDHSVQNRDIIALLFWWAEQGYITITPDPRDKKNYIFECRSQLPANARDYEREFFKGIFGGSPVGDRVELISLKYKLAPVMSRTKVLINKHAQQNDYYVRGTRAARVLMIMAGVLGVLTSIVLFIVAAASSFFVLSGRLDVPVGLFLSSVIVWSGGRRMVKWGEGGRKYITGLWGFREFIAKAEADKLRKLTEDYPSYFGQTLPYALAFGLADAWAAKFNDLNISPPSWYGGSGMMNISQFTQNIVHASNVISTNFTTTQSSSSGSSGFSSSGSSGGGSGGGGGGSW